MRGKRPATGQSIFTTFQEILDRISLSLLPLLSWHNRPQIDNVMVPLHVLSCPGDTILPYLSEWVESDRADTCPKH